MPITIYCSAKFAATRCHHINPNMIIYENVSSGDFARHDTIWLWKEYHNNCIIYVKNFEKTRRVYANHIILLKCATLYINDNITDLYDIIKLVPNVQKIYVYSHKCHI